MPLRDWKDERGWDSVHHFWLTYLVEWIQPRLPAGFRAYVGSVPALTLEGTNGKPDVTVRGWRNGADEEPKGVTTTLAPDREVVATFELDPQRAIHVDWHGQLIAALELTSPRNKDRVDSKARYSRRYLGYLRQGVHLMLIDVLPCPAGFSFPDAISADLGLGEPSTPPPCAVSYRVGGPIPTGDSMGTFMSVWRRTLEVGQPLPSLPLPLDDQQMVTIDLEETYAACGETSLPRLIRPSEVILAHRREDVQRLDRLIQGHHLVLHSAGDQPHVACGQSPRLVADREDHLAREQHADLLVRVRMFLDDGVRLDVHHRHHQLLCRRRANVDAGKDRVPAVLVWSRENLLMEVPRRSAFPG